MKRPIYTIVYQRGLANVFKVNQNRPYDRKRVLQADFKACENFLRGIAEAGGQVRRAWCNEAGDIAERPWSTGHFENAPFSESFASDIWK